jgi:Glycosyltransferase
MNILHLNTYTQKKNLTFPHYQFHKELLEKGHNSLIFTAKTDVFEKEIKSFKSNIFRKHFGLSRYIRKIVFEMLLNNNDNYYYPEWNLDNIKLKSIISEIPFVPDVIILYWTKFAFNQKMIYELSKIFDAPVICFMMDMAPLTGGCHYSFDCERYHEQCGMCPALNSRKEKDLSNRTWEYKKRYIEKTNISYIAASSTLYNQAHRSNLLSNKDIYRLMLGVSEKVFINHNKLDARKSLSIDIRKKVIFFGASSLVEKRKGLKYLVEALELISKNESKKFSNSDVLVLIAGSKFDQIEIPFEYKYLGYLSTENELALAYQASDLFVCPSIEDSGPLMISQAIMCGRPVVSFDMGIAPDLITNDETGYIAKIKDSGDLAYGLERVLSLNETDWVEMSKTCREIGLRECSANNTTDKLLEIIDEILLKNKGERL